MLEVYVSLGQIVALRPHRAGSTFGQVETDATLWACAYSGQIVALRRIERTSSSVNSGSMQRSRRALTQAESWPCAASSGPYFRSKWDRRNAPGVRSLRANCGLAPHQADLIFGQIGTDATLQACAHSGRIVALRRIKRTSPSVTTISDGLARPHSARSVPMPLLTPPKATSKTMPPSRGWHSFRRLVKNLTLRWSRREPRSLPREEKSTFLPT
jgi:hypothetical protein